MVKGWEKELVLCRGCGTWQHRQEICPKCGYSNLFKCMPTQPWEDKGDGPDRKDNRS